ncbi:MAG TPA: anti-sigma factor [Streptosporangiaceae bacterium]|nr:anti-sigma factor [Streptosporangiaceae bacterium]
MSHLGQRLSALIDGELDPAERDRVLVHLAKCDSCRGEAVALRTLKRRISALGGETAADGALTRRLMGLAYADGGFLTAGRFPTAGPHPAGAIPAAARWTEQRPGWYFGASAVAVFLAGISTAAFMVGGSQQVPAPKVTPAVDSYYLQHEMVTGVRPAARPGPAHPAGGQVRPAGAGMAAVRAGPARPGSVQSGAARSGAGQFGAAQHGSAQHAGKNAASHSP